MACESETQVGQTSLREVMSDADALGAHTRASSQGIASFYAAMRHSLRYASDS